MKKRLIITAIIIVLLIILLSIGTYILSFKKVSVSLQGNGYTVIVEDTKGTKLSTLSSSKSLSLQEGDYQYVVNGENYNAAAQKFSIKGDSTTITINPSYSEAYLSTLLGQQQTAIYSVFSTQYPSTYQTMNFIGIKLFDKGEWAAGTFSYLPNPTDIPEIYRFVLKYDGSNWSIVVPPQIAINKNSYKDVPVSILDSLYSADSTN